MKILLTGPTAVGKTAVSLALAKQLGAEIISTDSRQCYKYMNIGTATPAARVLEQIPHHNISIIDPSQKDSAGRFYERAIRWEKEITERGNTVLYVGGSTLHQQVIIQPFDEVPNADEENIAELEQTIAKAGIETLYKKLKQADPQYAAEMDGMNRQRIIRALDVWMQTGKPFSSFHSEKPISPPDDLLVFGLHRARNALYERINKRVEQMLETGFIKEVEEMLSMGYSKADPGLNTVGYQQIIDFLNGEISKSAMIADIKTKTRQYAKRQLTWFRKWDFIYWIDADKKSENEIADEICTVIYGSS